MVLPPKKEQGARRTQVTGQHDDLRRGESAVGLDGGLLDSGLGDAFAGHEGRIVRLVALGCAGLPEARAPARGQPAQVLEVVASGVVMREGSLLSACRSKRGANRTVAPTAPPTVVAY